MSAQVIIWAFHNRNRRLFYMLLSPCIAMPVTASKLGWCSTCHEVSSSDSSQRSTHMTASQMLKSSDDYVSMQCWHRFSTVRSTNRRIVFSINMQLALCSPSFVPSDSTNSGSKKIFCLYGGEFLEVGGNCMHRSLPF